MRININILINKSFNVINYNISLCRNKQHLIIQYLTWTALVTVILKAFWFLYFESKSCQLTFKGTALFTFN